MVVVRVVAFGIAGVAILYTALSAIHTFVLPRAAAVRLFRGVFYVMRKVVIRLARLRRSEATKDDTLALFAPLSLLLLPVAWMVIIGSSYAVMFWAVEQLGWRSAIATSASSVFTLGFVHPDGLPAILLAASEAAVGLVLLALLITYLPSMYSAFARREAQVALLASRAGDAKSEAPWAPTMIIRLHTIGAFDGIDDLWVAWEAWFVDVEESHLSLSALPYYRSPLPGRSWVTAAGTILDGAALVESSVDAPNSPRRSSASGPDTWPCVASPTSSGFPMTRTPLPTTRSPSREKSSTPRSTRWPQRGCR